MKLIIDTDYASDLDGAISDAERAADWCAALADAFRRLQDHPSRASLPVAAMPDEGSTVPAAPAATAPDEGSLPAPAPAKRRGRRPGSRNKPRELANGQSSDQAVSNATTDPVTAPANGHDNPIDRDQLHRAAVQRGIVWTSMLLAKHGVTEFADLTDAQLVVALDNDPA